MAVKKNNCVPVSIEICQIKYSSVLIYSYNELVGFSRPKAAANFGSYPRYNGLVSAHTAKRIRKAVDLFLQLSPKTTLFNPVTKKCHPFQLNFITLTISNNDIVCTGTDSYNKMLKPFLQWLTKTKKVTTFIWKAEVQKRGQLHYHITLNQFIHFKEIQEKWNYLQRKNNLLNTFYGEHFHQNPNSTDVHSVRTIKDIQAYLCKYLSKSGAASWEDAYYASKEVALVGEIYEGNILSCYPAQEFYRYEVAGKTWDCSDNLRGKKFYDVVIDSDVHTRLSSFKSDEKTRIFSNEWCCMFFNTDNSPLGLLNDSQLHSYEEHIKT